MAKWFDAHVDGIKLDKTTVNDDAVCFWKHFLEDVQPLLISMPRELWLDFGSPTELVITNKVMYAADT